MFVRTKKNYSGTVSVQVIDKSSGSYKVIKTIGSSSDLEEIKGLKLLAREYIMNFEGQQTFSFNAPTDSSFFETVYDSIRDVQMLGPEIVLGKIFDRSVLGLSRRIFSGI